MDESTLEHGEFLKLNQLNINTIYNVGSNKKLADTGMRA